jgi:PKD repeat protein
MTLTSLLRTPRPLLAAVTFAIATALAAAQPANNVHLSANARGAAAISALGAHLPEVARAYGLDANGLAALFRLQPSLGVDTGGALFFACDALAVPAGAPLALNGSTVGTMSTTTSTPSSADVLTLHSLPGASKVILLDFTGHTTSGTNWNSAYAGGSSIVSAPFDLDGDPSTFNETESGVILRIWQRVAEDYAPFAVDVTTEDPGLEALRKSTSSDQNFGVRAVISPTNWYNTGAGGVAYIGSFNWNSDTPCFAFTQQLANGEKYIAEAVAHEVGHTLGLYHDGVGGSSPSEYYTGQGSWAPIMGVGYYKSVTQFSKGEYANATNTQDDLAVIAGYAPLMTDDHGNTLASATVLGNPTVSDGGTIETRADVDTFRFDTGAGDISLNITHPNPEPDLNLKAELLNGSGQVLQSLTPITANTAFNTTLSAGTYYVRIACLGYGDPLTTGYSSYGSLGNYLITGTVVATGAKQAPTAVASASTTSGTAPLTVNFTGQNSSDSDGVVVGYRWDFGTGDSSTATNPGYTYTSPGTFNATLTVTDSDGLTNSASVTITVTAPANLPPVAAASASTTSGIAPLPVNFSSSGSYDADGSIISYLWDFGDGTSSTSAAPSKTYNNPGTFTARLTVTDDSGATDSTTIQITVASSPDNDVDVQQFALSTKKAPSGTTTSATVVVHDRLDRAVAGVTVTIEWTGVVSGTSSGKTDATGRVVLNSPRTKKSGVLTATISAVAPPSGAIYDATLFAAPTSLSIPIN